MHGLAKVLELDQVSKSYGSICALNQVSLSVYPGEVVALLGCNGAGKTSLVNIASGLLRPSSGKASVFGLDPSAQNAKEVRRILPQELSFPKNLRVREILELVYAHFRKPSAIEIAEEIGLTPLFERMTTDLSGGERRKLAFMCSLAGTPSLVLMDEPTSNIDMIGQESIRRVVRRYFKDGSRALIFSSHYMNEVESLADRVVVLDKGSVIFNGAVDQIKSLLGEKKVRFKSSKSFHEIKIPGASRVKANGSDVEVHGASSDQLLKEILKVDPSAVEIQIEIPTLEESILKIWDSKRSHRDG